MFSGGELKLPNFLLHIIIPRAARRHASLQTGSPSFDNEFIPGGITMTGKVEPDIKQSTLRQIDAPDRSVRLRVPKPNIFVMSFEGNVPSVDLGFARGQVQSFVHLSPNNPRGVARKRPRRNRCRMNKRN